ncbi:MAG: RidA family protein [Chitinophagaceae bacterium]|nr:RidA family protein [Chitinophagaceae bacterium]
MKGIGLLLAVVIFFQVDTIAQKTDPEKKLKELGIVLKKPPVPVANYVPAVQVGKMVYLSGQGPLNDNGEFTKGKVGDEITLEQGQAAARLAGIRLLEALKGQIGDLNKVKRIVKVLGMVNAVPTFDQHPKVINGFSDFMVEVFGANGKHARSAVGVGSLPANIPVEIEMIVELK